MLTANGALPIILTIILVHSISYIRPVRPERKKQIRTKISMFLVDLCETLLLLVDLCDIFLLAIFCPDCFTRESEAKFQLFLIILSSFSSCSMSFFKNSSKSYSHFSQVRMSRYGRRGRIRTMSTPIKSARAWPPHW